MPPKLCSVLMLGPYLEHRGSFVTTELALGLRDRGFHVDLVSSAPPRALRALHLLSAAWHQSAHHDVVVIDVFSGRTYFALVEAMARLARRRCGALILNLHGGALPQLAARQPRRVRRLLQLADHVVTPSHYVQKSMQRLRADVGYMPNGLDLETFHFRQREVIEPHLIWVRSVDAIYRPLQAIEVLAHIRKDFPNAHLTMVGGTREAALQARCESLTREHGLYGRVHFTGAVGHGDVATHLNRADIFLNTTSVESFGLSMMEAAASGLCLVSTDAGELPHLWQHGNDALLVGVDQPEVMGDAVLRLLRDQPLAQRLSGSARERAEEFSWPNVLARWEGLLATAQQP